LPNGLSDKT